MQQQNEAHRSQSWAKSGAVEMFIGPGQQGQHGDDGASRSSTSTSTSCTTGSSRRSPSPGQLAPLPGSPGRMAHADMKEGGQGGPRAAEKPEPVPVSNSAHPGHCSLRSAPSTSWVPGSAEVTALCPTPLGAPGTPSAGRPPLRSGCATPSPPPPQVACKYRPNTDTEPSPVSRATEASCRSSAPVRPLSLPSPLATPSGKDERAARATATCHRRSGPPDAPWIRQDASPHHSDGDGESIEKDAKPPLAVFRKKQSQRCKSNERHPQSRSGIGNGPSGSGEHPAPPVKVQRCVRCAACSAGSG